MFLYSTTQALKCSTSKCKITDTQHIVSSFERTWYQNFTRDFLSQFINVMYYGRKNNLNFNTI